MSEAADPTGRPASDPSEQAAPREQAATPPVGHPPAEPPTLAYPVWRPSPYGSPPYAQTPVPESAPAARRPLVEMADLWTALLGTIGVVLLGFLATLIWVWIAPRALAVKDAQGGVSLVAPETKAFVGADVAYLFVTLGAGIVCGLVAALIARHRGPAVSIAMAAGGVLAALLVAWLGRWITGGPVVQWAHQHSTGQHRYFIELQARQFVMAWPVVALVITFVVALFSPDPAPGTEPAHPSPAPH